MKRAIDAVIGLAVAAFGILALEQGLALAGVGDRPETVNSSRGFDPSAAYLIPHDEPPGSWKTQFGDGKVTERVITPRRPDLIRVEVFGGSNTYGFNVRHLAGALAKNAGKRAYEAFNLGRPGYGSERVKFILDQAVEHTEPDVVVIYSGHNEFVERGFQMDLEEKAPTGLLAAPAELVSRSRLYRGFLASSAPRESRQAKPSAWKWEYQKFADLQYDETLAYFAAYERNLRSMCKRSLKRGVRVMICTVIHNRLSKPFVSNYDEARTPEEVAACEAKLAEAQALLPDYFGLLLPTEEIERPNPKDYASGPVKDRDGGTLESWQKMTGPLAGRSRKIPSNDVWTPVVSEVDRALVKLHAGDLGGRSKADLERAETLYREVLEIEDDHPLSHFILGLLGYPLGRDRAAMHEQFELAAVMDRAPRKGSDLTNAIVRRVAADMEGVELFDADALFEECHPDGIVGWDWMMDHCHLHVGGRLVLMEMLADRIYEVWPPSEFPVGGE